MYIDNIFHIEKCGKNVEREKVTKRRESAN